MTTANEQNQWIWDQMWGNIQKVQQFQQEIGKTAIKFIRNQQDLYTSFQQNYDQLEEESKIIISNFLENVKATDEKMSETWNEKKIEMAALIEKTNEVTLRFLEHSQQKMYDFLNAILSEQNILQKEIVQNLESFVKQIVPFEDDLKSLRS